MARVGCSAGKWSLKITTKTGAFGSWCWWQSVIQKRQSPEQWQQRPYWDMIGLSRISEMGNVWKKKKVWAGKKLKISSCFSVFQISLCLFYLSTEGHGDLTMGQLKTHFR